MIIYDHIPLDGVSGSVYDKSYVLLVSHPENQRWEDTPYSKRIFHSFCNNFSSNNYTTGIQGVIETPQFHFFKNFLAIQYVATDGHVLANKEGGTH